jgi:uncharacterized protein YgbK (DUF1537 family)
VQEKRYLIVPIRWKGDEEVDSLQALLPFFENRSIRGVILSGGDTAGYVCGVLRVKGIRLQREVVTGLPCGRLIGGPADELAACTKAGGFGGEDALVVVTDFLTQQES